MSVTTEHDAPRLAVSTGLVRTVAALMPALVISFSALIEPLVNLGTARGQYFGGVELEGESKTRLAQLVMPLFLLTALTLAALAPPRVPGRLLRVVTPAALLLAMALLSSVWAQDMANTLKLALYQAVLFAALLLFVTVARDGERVMRWVTLAFAAAVAANLVAVATQPAGDIGHQGIYFYKNTLGAAGGCAFLFGLFHVVDPRWRWRLVGWFTTVGAVVIVIASISKTALAMMLVAPVLAVGFLVASRVLSIGPMASTVLLALCGTGAFVVGLGVAGVDTDDVMVATYGGTTFTGRTFIWGFALDYWANAPWIGNGYRGFWGLGQASPKHGSEIEFIRTIGSGHNGYIDMMLDLGVIGLGLLVAFTLAAFSAAGRFALRPTRRSLLYMSVVLFVAGRNAMESVILWSSFFDNLAFLLVAFLACYREEPRPRTRAA